MKANEKTVEAILEMKPTETKKELKLFHGTIQKMANF